jgi:hypothetical protein
MRKGAVRIIILLAIFFIHAACTNEEPELPNPLRRQADSIFNSRTSEIKKEVDSLCDLRFDSMVKIKYDSIVEKRSKRIKELSK